MTDSKTLQEVFQSFEQQPQSEEHLQYLEAKGFSEEEAHHVRFCEYPYCTEENGITHWHTAPSTAAALKNLEGEIQSIQYIFYHKELERFEKRFHKGTSPSDLFLPLDVIEGGSHLFITEGYATGLSLRKILRSLKDFENAKVVCAFTASNIVKVSTLLKQKFPEIEIIPAPDHDQAGGKAAKECKDALGLEPIFPPQGQDWNDVLIEKDLSQSSKVFQDSLKVRNHSQKLEDIYDHAETAIEHVKLIPKIENILDEIEENPCKDFSMEHFPPVLKKYIESICKTTKAHPIMIVMSVLCSISAMVGKKVYMKEGVGKAFQNLYPNIWSLCITKSGGFKTTALNKGAEIAVAKDREILKKIRKMEREEEESYLGALGGKRSQEDREKFERKVLEEVIKSPMLPNRQTTESLMKHLSLGHQGMVMLSELGEWLGNMGKSHNKDLKQIFTSFYDVDIPPYRYFTKVSGSYIIENPFVTLNTVSTVEWVYSDIKSDDVFSGFFARFLLFTPPYDDSIPDARPKAGIKSDEASRNKIKDTLENIGSFCFKFTEESGALFDNIHSSIYYMARNKKYDEKCQLFLEPYAKRWSPYVLKLAMLFRIIEDPFSDELTTTSIKASTEIVRVAIKSTAKLFEKELGESKDQKKQRKVFEWVVKRKVKGVNAEYYALTRSKLLDGGSKEYEEVVQTLIDSRKISCPNQSDPKQKWLLEVKNV